jgi:hypothetical protein
MCNHTRGIFIAHKCLQAPHPFIHMSYIPSYTRTGHMEFVAYWCFPCTNMCTHTNTRTNDKCMLVAYEFLQVISSCIWFDVYIVPRRDMVPECGNRCPTHALSKLHPDTSLAAAVFFVCGFWFCVPENWPCLRFYTRKHLSVYVQSDVGMLYKQHIGTDPSGFAIYACMNKGSIKPLCRDIFTSLCYACAYAWKTLNPASARSHPFFHNACMHEKD